MVRRQRREFVQEGLDRFSGREARENGAKMYARPFENRLATAHLWILDDELVIPHRSVQITTNRGSRGCFKPAARPAGFVGRCGACSRTPSTLRALLAAALPSGLLATVCKQPLG